MDITDLSSVAGSPKLIKSASLVIVTSAGETLSTLTKVTKVADQTSFIFEGNFLMTKIYDSI